MSLSAENKKLRHYRIQQMYKELQSFNMSTEFIEDALCKFFTVGPATIYNVIKEDEIRDVYYEHIDLDKKWAEQLVRKVQSSAYRAAQKKRSNDKSQIKMQL